MGCVSVSYCKEWAANGREPPPARPSQDGWTTFGLAGEGLGWAGLGIETGLFTAFVSGRGTAETTAFLLFTRTMRTREKYNI